MKYCFCVLNQIFPNKPPKIFNNVYHQIPKQFSNYSEHFEALKNYISTSLGNIFLSICAQLTRSNNSNCKIIQNHTILLIIFRYYQNIFIFSRSISNAFIIARKKVKVNLWKMTFDMPKNSFSPPSDFIPPSFSPFLWHVKVNRG